MYRGRNIFDKIWKETNLKVSYSFLKSSDSSLQRHIKLQSFFNSNKVTVLSAGKDLCHRHNLITVFLCLAHF